MSLGASHRCPPAPRRKDTVPLLLCHPGRCPPLHPSLLRLLGARLLTKVPQLSHLSFSSLLHLAPLTSPSEELGFGVGKMSLGFSQIQYPLEPKPISLAQGPAIEGLSLLFKPPRAQLL